MIRQKILVLAKRILEWARNCPDVSYVEFRQIEKNYNDALAKQPVKN